MGLHSLPTHHAGNDQSPSTTQQRMSSRTFTADEFPALKGSLYCLINVGKCADQMHKIVYFVQITLACHGPRDQ
jgi:hypothetical protein